MKRSKFSLSHTRLTALDMGQLVPIGLVEVLPGDTIQWSTAALLRCSPLLAPVMHPVSFRIHHWYVPHRLVWEDFEDFITGGPDGMDDSVFPTVSALATGVQLNTLGDYFGLPLGIAGMTVSALPFRGYFRIWNEFYRDQDLQPEIPMNIASGPDTMTGGQIQNVCWEKDYFTSSRPWEQKGPAITIPIAGVVPVMPGGPSDPWQWVAGGASQALFQRNVTGNMNWQTANSPTGTGDAKVNVGSWRPGLQVDLAESSMVTINVLREAFALQRFEEARARYGSRYTEYLRYLGVRSSDARLQRPEYLGGGKQTIQFSEVLQVAPGDADKVGTMRGHGISAMRSNRYRRFIEEHGYIHTFVSIVPKTMYSQGMRRHWNRRFKEDFWQKELQHIGQQEVYQREVYAASPTPGGVFGYQDRYDEYRREESQVTSEMRTLLNYWHLGREFASDPALNASFVSCVPTERVFADNQEKTMYLMASHSVQARRLVAKTGSSFIF